MAPAVDAATTVANLVMLPLTQLKPSPLNPRKSFDQGALEELARTMAPPVGVIEPLVARRVLNGHHEIIAGERRWRAATIAKLETVPVVIKEMDDAQVLELMVIENNQRRDLNALEEADGFKRLLTFGFDIDKLASRIGHTRKYIYDRVKLLELVPAAQVLLLEGRITPGHAIPIARLTPEQQDRAIDPARGGLFMNESYLWDPATVEDGQSDDDWPPLAGKKTVTVRELHAWIDETFRLSTNPDPELFPETTATLDAAIEAEEQVVQITYKHHVTPENKEGGSRILGPLSWKRADGSFTAFKTCDRSVTGVIVIGPHRGEAFKVCVDKECNVHWATEQRQREKAKKAAESGASPTTSSESNQARWKREDAERQSKHQAFDKASPAILQACADKVKTVAIGKVVTAILEMENRREVEAAVALIGKGKTPEHALRLLLMLQIVNDCSVYNLDGFAKSVKGLLGVDVKAIVRKAPAATAEPVTTSGQTSPGRPKKAKASKKRR